jgi:NADH dehydrogenase
VALDGKAPRVVIVGAGFGGLLAARELGRAPVHVTLIDRRNHHLFQPLLYQVATAVLNPSDIAAPIRRIIRADNTAILLGDVTAVDVAKKCVRLDADEVPYDYLILATGSAHSYFGHDEWEPNAPGLKSIEDAINIRQRVLFAFEAAEREPDPEKRKQWLNFVVVGGGATGVELAGALAEISRGSLAQNFRHFDPKQATVILIEGLPRLLTTYPEALSAHAAESLSRIGVDVRLGTMVTDVREDGVVAGGQFIPARTVLWGAGVAASSLGRSLGADVDKAGRVRVTPELTVPGHNEVFVVGDLAALESGGHPVPGIAPAAMQEGKHAAVNVLRAVRGQPLLPFHYWDRGSFAVIGRGAAVGVLFGKANVSGLFAWLGWLLIHIYFLIGFRNRVAVLFNWAFSFFTLRRNAQLITGEDRRKLPALGHEGDRVEDRPSTRPTAVGSEPTHP